MSTQATLPEGWGALSNTNQTSNDKQGGLFMRLEVREKPFIVRLVSSPEVFRQHWDAFKPLQPRPVISPVFDVTDKDKDIAWSVGGWVPSKKYAILVIDREDGKLKIMQGGEQIFGEFKKYIEAQKKLNRDPNPTGQNAPDWVITVTKKDGQTHYDCSPDMAGPKPLTQAEIEMVANFKVDWRGFFKKPSPEELKSMWEKIPEEKRYNPDPKKKGPVSVVPTNSPIAAPAAPATSTPVTQAATQSKTDEPATLF